MPLRRSLAVLLLSAGAALAADDLPDAQDLADAAARRFPQPVRVGDLIARRVLEPVESRPVLGHVRAVVKQRDGTLAVVMSYGGWLGLFTHPIAVPVNAMVLLGQEMEVADFTPQQLDRFVAFDPARAVPLAPAAVIRVGIAKPSH